MRPIRVSRGAVSRISTTSASRFFPSRIARALTFSQLLVEDDRRWSLTLVPSRPTESDAPWRPGAFLGVRDMSAFRPSRRTLSGPRARRGATQPRRIACGRGSCRRV
jgi:hypothetical protein